jgi:hypothetical protein
MSNEKTSLQAILEQYEANNKPKYEKKSEKVYDLKNYFNTYIKDGVKSATKQIRILPSTNGGTPFVEMQGHKIQVDGEWKTFPCLKHEKDEACPFCEAREALLSTGKDYGFSDAELNSIVDPRHVKVLHDAMQWRKLQKNSTVKNKISNAKPVVKPGAKDSKSEANSNHRNLREQLRKTGKSDAATKLIENML